MGYVKGGSKPSLIAGLGLGASYGIAGESDIYTCAYIEYYDANVSQGTS